MTDLSLDALEQIAKPWLAELDSSAQRFLGYATGDDNWANRAKEESDRAHALRALIAAARPQSPVSRPTGEEVAKAFRVLEATGGNNVRPEARRKSLGVLRSALSTLSAERDAMEAALKPFAEAFGYGIPRPDDFHLFANLTLGDFRRAQAALQHKGETNEQ